MPPGKPTLPRDRPVPPPKPPGPPLKITDASLAQGDLVIIRSTSSAFQSLAGLVSQNSLDAADTQAEITGRPTAIRTMPLRVTSMMVGRQPMAAGLPRFFFR